MMNIAMNLGIAPVIGLPLPFISYGGSSMWMSLIAVGILESIVIHRTEFS
jgi:rod shape determining protein RodA